MRSRFAGIVIVAPVGILVGVAASVGCRFPQRDYSPPVPPPTPVAIAGLNSPYDDFNSASHEFVYGQLIVFSTNRGSNGEHYDLYAAKARWTNWHEGKQYAYAVDGRPSSFSVTEVEPFSPGLMSDGDERGPIFLSANDAPLGSRNRFVFASDRAGGHGGLDLYAAGPYGDGPLRPLVGINTAGDDAYLTVSPVPRQMLLASNETPGAPLDIYAVTWAEKDNIDNTIERREVLTALSSSADDTAPFVYFVDEDRRHAEVIFASSRPGGLGEHDLYCSRYADTRTAAERDDEARRATIRGYAEDARAWTKPVLLRELSSPRDEYRPMVFEKLGARYLVFSSTREGGQGGYDLYVVEYKGCPR